MTFSSGIEMYAYVKNVLVQVKLHSYPTIQQLFTSNNEDWQYTHCNRTMVPTVWTMKNNFKQIKKLIAINDRKNIARRGTKTMKSTLYCGKCYPLVHIGERIFKTTRRAMYMMKNENNRIKIWIFWGDRRILHCLIRYCGARLGYHSTTRIRIIIFHKG